MASPSTSRELILAKMEKELLVFPTEPSEAVQATQESPGKRRRHFQGQNSPKKLLETS